MTRRNGTRDETLREYPYLEAEDIAEIGALCKQRTTHAETTSDDTLRGGNDGDVRVTVLMTTTGATQLAPFCVENSPARRGDDAVSAAPAAHHAARSQPTGASLTAARCYHPASRGVGTEDKAQEAAGVGRRGIQRSTP